MFLNPFKLKKKKKQLLLNCKYIILKAFIFVNKKDSPEIYHIIKTDCKLYFAKIFFFIQVPSLNLQQLNDKWNN